MEEDGKRAKEGRPEGRPMGPGGARPEKKSPGNEMKGLEGKGPFGEE